MNYEARTEKKGFMNSVILVTASHQMAEICQSGENALGVQPMSVTAQHSNIVERSLAKILAMWTEKQNGPLERAPAERAAVATRGHVPTGSLPRAFPPACRDDILALVFSGCWRPAGL